MNTPNLFDSVPYQKHSVTSIEAAHAYKPKVGTKAYEVLAFIASTGVHGVTDAELTAVFMERGWSPNSARPRRIDLTDYGYVHEKRVCGDHGDANRVPCEMYCALCGKPQEAATRRVGGRDSVVHVATRRGINAVKGEKK